MKFEVDRDKWEHPNNAKPLRSYARQQREEAKHQIDVLLEKKMIESCQAIHHSHMLKKERFVMAILSGFPCAQ